MIQPLSCVHTTLWSCFYQFNEPTLETALLYVQLQSYRTRFHKLSTLKQQGFGMKFRHVFFEIPQKDQDVRVFLFCFSKESCPVYCIAFLVSFPSVASFSAIVSLFSCSFADKKTKKLNNAYALFVCIQQEVEIMTCYFFWTCHPPVTENRCFLNWLVEFGTMEKIHSTSILGSYWATRGAFSHRPSGIKRETKGHLINLPVINYSAVS